METMDPKELRAADSPQHPVFSVVVPAYNARSTIGSTVESVLQNDVPLEVLVVDDGSADPIQAEDCPHGPVQLIRRETNGGSARARNRGILAARGHWIAFLDADDEYEPGRLDAADRFLASTPRLDGLITDTVLLWPDGSSEVAAPRPNEEGLLHLRTGYVAGAIVLSRDVFEDVGLYDPHWQLQEDEDFCLRVLLSGARIGYIPRPAYVYRINLSGRTQGADPIKRCNYSRDVHLSNAVRPAIPLTTRGLLLARALKWERQALPHRLNKVIGRGGSGHGQGRSK